MSDPQQDTAPPQPLNPNFAVNIYRGCVLPEDYKPVRITTWLAWAETNPDDYSAEQLEQIRLRLLRGKSWVAFVATLETIAAPEHYKPAEPYCNPVQGRERLV